MQEQHYEKRSNAQQSGTRRQRAKQTWVSVQLVLSTHSDAFAVFPDFDAFFARRRRHQRSPILHVMLPVRVFACSRQGSTNA